MVAVTICFDPETKVYVHLSREDRAYTVASGFTQIGLATITQLFDGMVKADCRVYHRLTWAYIPIYIQETTCLSFTSLLLPVII